MKAMKISVWIFTIIFTFSSCQAFFTYSPFSSMQRDFSDLSSEEKITRAQDVLKTGDTEDMQEAYDAIIEMLADNPEDPELNILAAELAVGASGIMDVLLDAISNSDNEDFDIEIAIEDLNVDILSDVADHVSIALDGGGDVSDETLVIAAATSVLEAIDEGAEYTDLEDWDPESGVPLVSDNPQLVEASEFILAMDDPGEIMDSFSQYFSN